VSEYALFVESGPRAGETIPILSAESTVGRHPYAEIDLHDPKASRRHARLMATPAGIRVEDLGSSNGTFVQGVRVRERALIPGETFEIGDTRLCVIRPAEERLLGLTVGGVRILRWTGGSPPARFYLGRQEGLARDVRIEALAQSFLRDEDLAAAYRKAVQAAGGLRHPDVLRVYDWLEGPHGPLVVAEPEEGMPLGAGLEPLREVPVAARIRLAGRFLDALDELASAGIPWPTSPGRVVWTPDARLRFRAPDSRDLWEIRTGDNLRDPDLAAYVSPEGISGGQEGDASRAHVAGCFAHAILCAEPPYEGSDAMEILRAKREAEPPDPASRAAGIPRAISVEIQRALSPNPAAEAPSLAGLLSAWRRADPTGAPPVAMPPPERRPVPSPVPLKTSAPPRPRRRAGPFGRFVVTIFAEALAFAAAAVAVYVAMRILYG